MRSSLIDCVSADPYPNLTTQHVVEREGEKLSVTGHFQAFLTTCASVFSAGMSQHQPALILGSEDCGLSWLQIIAAFNL